MMVIEADKGESISQFIHRMRLAATSAGITVVGEFNSIAFVAHPEQTQREVGLACIQQAQDVDRGASS